ncbi:MAG: hypothetical protein KKA73_31245, partial [Chloroflexi bacterium]|nr:hypothetical protein [Chloroflexota bacterium]
FRLTTFIATDAGEPLPDMSGLPQQASSVLTLTPAADPSQPGGLGTAIHEYHHLVFPEPGRYWVMVVLDNILVAQVPLWALALEEV